MIRPIDLTHKCGSCKFMDLNDKNTAGYKCTKSDARCPYWPRTREACKKHEHDPNKPNIVESLHVKYIYTKAEYEKAIEKAIDFLEYDSDQTREQWKQILFR